MTFMARLGSLSFFPAPGRLFLLGRRGGPPTRDLVVGPRHPFHAMANPFSVGCYSGRLLGQQRAAARYSWATGRSRASGGRGSSPGRVRWLDPAAGQGTTGWEAISSDATMGTSDRGNPSMHTPGNWVASPTNSSGGSTSYVLLLVCSNRLLMAQTKDFHCFHTRTQTLQGKYCPTGSS